MTIWLLIIAIAMVTFFNRYLFFAKSIRYKPGAKMTQFLTFSAQAVLTAIWAPILFSYQSGTGLSYAGNDYLIAALAVATLALLRVHMLLTVIIGIGLFAVLRFM